MLPRIKFGGWAALSVVLAATLSGCGDAPTDPLSDGAGPVSEAPELPPLQSMQMDLSFFGSPGQAPTSDAEGLKLNFLNAAVRAAYIQVTVATIMAPPTLAFAAAIHTYPSYVDGSYLWIYTWVDDGQDHQIRLRGTPMDNHVDWELYVALPGADPELWFSGQSRTDRDQGHWRFRDFTAEGDPEVLRVDWEVNSDVDAFLTFRNVYVGQEEEGDELRYRADGVMRSIEFADASTGEDWDIIWNEADGSGSLRVPDYNGGVRACWDSNQEDVECAATAGEFLAIGATR
jgi:hypothetical protein